MKVSANGLKIIKNFEELRLNAYRDVAGVLTIGYGSTRYRDGNRVKPDDKLTNEIQAESLLINTLAPYENAVNEDVKVTLTQNQYDALLSFTYNEGTGALAASSLLALLNQKKYLACADHFLMWDKITDPHTGDKIVCNTLVQRREQERKLFLTADK